MTEQEAIDELAELLDARERGEPSGEVDASTLALATLAERLGDAVTVPGLTLPARRRVGQRVAAAALDPAGSAGASEPSGRDDAPAQGTDGAGGTAWSTAALRLAAGLVAALTIGAGAVAASGDAQPGTALHPVKLAAERAEITLAGDELDTARVHLDHAEARLRELEAGLPSDPEDTAATLGRWAASSTAAEQALRGDQVPAPVADEVLLAFVQQQRDRLLAVAPALPEDLLPTAVGAVELLDRFEQESTA